MGTQTTRPSRVAIPSDRAWFDPRLITLSVMVEPGPIVVPPNEVFRVAKLNPERVALSVMLGAAAVANPYIAPHNQPDSFPWKTLSAGEVFHITLQDGLALITGEWYMHIAAGATIMVIEQIRRGIK